MGFEQTKTDLVNDFNIYITDVEAKHSTLDTLFNTRFASATDDRARSLVIAQRQLFQKYFRRDRRMIGRILRILNNRTTNDFE